MSTGGDSPVAAISLPDAVAVTREYLHANWVEGVACPTCHRRLKVYKRPFNSGMVRALIMLYRLSKRLGSTNGLGWVKVSVHNLPKQTCLDLHHLEYSKLKHWDVIESQGATNSTDDKSGIWRLTPLGVRFLTQPGETVPERIWLVLDTVLLRETGRVTALQALGTTFDFGALMNGDWDSQTWYRRQER